MPRAQGAPPSAGVPCPAGHSPKASDRRPAHRQEISPTIPRKEPVP